MTAPTANPTNNTTATPAFTAGLAVIISPDLKNAAGKTAVHAGKNGVLLAQIRGGKWQVDVAGLPVATVTAKDLTPATAPVTTTPPPERKHANIQPVPGTVTYGLEVLAVAAMVESLTNPRRHFDPTKLLELSESIKAQGLAQPILVRPLPGVRLLGTFTDRRSSAPRPTHEIVAGHRRHRACVMANVRTVPVLVRNLTDEQVLELQIIENVQREDLHPLEEAQGYRRLIDNHGHDVAKLAHSVKKSTRYIYTTLQLLKLCDFAQGIFLRGDLHRSTALQIATIGNEGGQIEATRRIAGLGAHGTEVVNDPLSQRAAAQFVANNYRLILASAPFNTGAELAGAPPCAQCPKNSANARELFDTDDGKATAPTCTDPSCYGQKNAAHNTALLDAAQKSGQRVVRGKAAQKVVASEYTDTLKGYSLLDDKRFDVADKHQGQTLRQLLGKDCPAPVVVEHPTTKKLIECLPDAQARALLQAKGLMPKPSNMQALQDKQRATDAKHKAETAARTAIAHELMQAAPQFKSTPAGLVNLAMLRLWDRLDDASHKRACKLLGWPAASAYASKAILQKIEALNTPDACRFIVACSVAAEMHVSNETQPATIALDHAANVLGVDTKAIRKKLAGEDKTTAKAS